MVSLMNSWFENLCQKYLDCSLHPLNNTKISITENSILGRINSDESDTIFVKISFEKFSDDEIEKLNKIVYKNYLNEFKIKNDNLPIGLFAQNIKILPETFNDMEISCESENYARDVLSILNVFNKRLKSNPSLILKMKGLELKDKSKWKLKSLDDVLGYEYRVKKPSKILKNLYDINTTLLKDVRYTNKSYDLIYDEMIKILIDELVFLKNHTQTFSEVKNIKFRVDEKYNFESGVFKNTDELLLYTIAMSDKQKVGKQTQYLCDVLKLIETLLHHNAIIPDLFVSNGVGQIRWIPAVHDDNVRNYCQRCFNKIPKDFVSIKYTKISPKTQSIVLISLFMDALIRYSFDKNELILENRDISRASVFLLTGNKVEITNKKHLETLISIDKKFSVFYNTTLDFEYLMCIDDDLVVEIKIKRNGQIHSLDKASPDELQPLKSIYDLFTYFGVKNRAYEKIKLSGSEFATFVLGISEYLKFLNIELQTSFILADEMKLIMDYDKKAKAINRENLDKVEWYYEIDGNQISINEFEKLKYDDEILKYDKYYLIVKRQDYLNMKITAKKLPEIKENRELLKLALLEDYYDIKFETSKKLKKLINPSGVYEVPRSLNAKLRSYQKIGYSWLVQNIQSGFGSILADDMGLGKTIQVLTAILHFKDKRFIDNQTALIIVPPTLISNWENEIKKFTPTLTYYTYYGSNRQYPLEDYDIVLTSYNVLRSDLELFLDDKWFVCVIDEAQNIKNPNTKITRAVKQIHAHSRIALTGTPIENHLSDYWSLFDFTNKNYLSSQKKFKENYMIPIERLENQSVVDNLKRIAKPFVLRRLKSDDNIKHELPEKETIDICTTLSKKQIKLYNAILDGVFDEIDISRGIKRTAAILRTIMSLKQVCNHPAQYINIENPTIKDSGKMEMLANLIENILDAKEKVIIFTQFIKTGELIQELISKKFGVKVLFLRGSLNGVTKNKIINSFQEDDRFKILVATLKTGGIGLNLTAAQNVIHYDLWWNPAVENQATDRVYRIGQQNDVMVYRFITKGTFEEEIDRILKSKADLAEKAISSDETFITELSTEELKKILNLRLSI